MSLKVYNVLSRKKEEFIPLEEGKVKMYACGITASGDAHIGHAYQAIIFDVIKKYLEYIGYDVTYVRNYTDVDDKIIIKARELGVNPMDYANKTIKKTDEELSRLFVDKPTIESKATECISDMIFFIEKLIEKGHAYSTENGDVFFKVSSFSDYGKLSNRIVDDSLSGVRINIEPGKLDDKDFALWKNAKDDEIYWESPWGPGRPGWHIECSAMGMKYLGETIDIHGGGRDLIFPHHENEIAQSESLTGKMFSKYWLHNGLIKVNGQKMSKSLNNGILIEEVLDLYNPEVIRITLLENNYRSDMNIVDGIFEIYESKIYNIYKLFYLIDDLGKNLKSNKNSEDFKIIDSNFRKAMNNDFNTSVAISDIFEYVNTINKLIKENNIQRMVDIKYALVNIYKVLGLLGQEPNKVIEEIKNKYLKINNISEEKINNMIIKRQRYKEEKNWNEADKIRDELYSKRIIIKDGSKKTEWDIDIPFKQKNGNF
ncbi:MAG: cysteine--tRNA ligase [Mollicutes bacterium]|nr:cysteine--tRNA ligase [Mollicutes bacterium]